MPDDNATVQTTAPPTAAAAPPDSGGATFAGKYKSPEALEQGYRELVKSAGVDEIAPDTKLYGEGGMFRDVTSLEKGYTQLQKLYSKVGASKPAAAAAPIEKPGDLSIKSPPQQTAATIKGAEAVVKAAGLDPKVIAEKWAKDGRLSDDEYKAIEGQGRSREEVDAFFDGLKAKAEVAKFHVERVKSEVDTMLGGKEQHEALRNWAAENIPQAELDKLSKQVEADPTFYPTMMEIVNARYNAKIGAGGSRPLIGGTAPSTSAQAVSASEMSAVLAAARRGDPAAMKRLEVTPLESFTNFAS